MLPNYPSLPPGVQGPNSGAGSTSSSFTSAAPMPSATIGSQSSLSFYPPTGTLPIVGGNTGSLPAQQGIFGPARTGYPNLIQSPLSISHHSVPMIPSMSSLFGSMDASKMGQGLPPHTGAPPGIVHNVPPTSLPSNPPFPSNILPTSQQHSQSANIPQKQPSVGSPAANQPFGMPSSQSVGRNALTNSQNLAPSGSAPVSNTPSQAVVNPVSNNVLPPNQPTTPSNNDPRVLRSKLLALAPSNQPAEMSRLKTIRPVDLPSSPHRRDAITCDRKTLAYVSVVRQAYIIRVWRQTDSEASSGSKAFSTPKIFSLTEHVGDVTDMHLGSMEDTLLASGDASGCVSVWSLAHPDTQIKTQSRCLVRIIPNNLSPPARVVRVFWHPINPYLLAIAYSDSTVSVWDISLALNPASCPTNLQVPSTSSGPLVYTRPTLPSTPTPLVVTVSHGTEVVTDVVIWNKTLFTSTESGSVFLHDLSTGAIQRVMRLHQYGIESLVLVKCTSPESGKMPLFATTSAKGTELKLWRHASPSADWTGLQSLSLPEQTAPYILSRAVSQNTLYIYTPTAGLVWELKLFEEEMALLPTNFFRDLVCSVGLVGMPEFKLIAKYHLDELILFRYTGNVDQSDEAAPANTASVANPTPVSPSMTPANQVMPASNPVQAPEPVAAPSAPKPATYHQIHEEASIQNVGHHVQTQVPPEVSADLPVPSTQKRTKTTSQANPSMKPNVALIQSILDESSNELENMIREEEASWKVEDKKFLMKISDASKLIPTLVAKGITQSLEHAAQAPIDVTALTQSLAAALSGPIGQAFKEQFGKVLIPGLEDTTAKMLSDINTKLESGIKQHSQNVAVHQISKSVEPLVSSLLTASSVMAKTISETKIPIEMHAPKTNVAASSSSASKVAAPFPVAAAPTNNTPKARTATPTTAAASSSAPVKSNPKPNQVENPKADPIQNTKKETSTPKHAKKVVAVVPAKPKVSSSNQNTQVNDVPSLQHPMYYYLFALSNGVSL